MCKKLLICEPFAENTCKVSVELLHPFHMYSFSFKEKKVGNNKDKQTTAAIVIVV